MNKTWTTIVIVVIVFAAGWIWMSSFNSSNAPMPTPGQQASNENFSQDTQNIQIDEVDSQFQSIDSDINSL